MAAFQAVDNVNMGDSSPVQLRLQCSDGSTLPPVADSGYNFARTVTLVCDGSALIGVRIFGWPVIKQLAFICESNATGAPTIC